MSVKTVTIVAVTAIALFAAIGAAWNLDAREPRKPYPKATPPPPASPVFKDVREAVPDEQQIEAEARDHNAQLERLIERAIALCDSEQIDLDDLPLAVRGEYAVNLMPSIVRNDTMRAWGSRYAQLVVSRCGGNKRQACRILGISYHTLQSYLRSA